MSRPPVLIPHAPGTNRDAEAALAVTAAGGDPQIVAVNELRKQPAGLSDYGAVLLPGGFSYGDALGAGGRLALELRAWFGAELRQAARAGKPILGICNGFQTLVKSGLLGPRSFTLAANAGGRFECRWVTLRIEPDCKSSWLAPLGGSRIRCPVAHGEGRFAVAGSQAATELTKAGCVAFRYLASGTQGGAASNAAGVYPANPNGSVDDIAGMCDPTGAVVGLMPHPEDHIADWQRPSGPPGERGSALFEAFVDAAR
ncbi:MAG: phosphoribosylformylglycinamidine synthase subunit PurQ [Acidimicrobiia bacterium]|nr:phosphoribosylformylglycinamidine synthase subunit PurQ [Acidimicrobiia bacterium]